MHGETIKNEWECFGTGYGENFWTKQDVSREWKNFNWYIPFFFFL